MKTYLCRLCHALFSRPVVDNPVVFPTCDDCKGKRPPNIKTKPVSEVSLSTPEASLLASQLLSYPRDFVIPSTSDDEDNDFPS